MAGAKSGDAALGAAIRSARERVGWPQARLAQDAGFGQTWLSAVETGARGIDPRDLAKIASTLGVSVDSLLGTLEADDESEFMLAMRRYDPVISSDPRAVRRLIRATATEAEEIEATRMEVSDEEREVVESVRRLGPEAMAEVLAAIRSAQRRAALEAEAQTPSAPVTRTRETRRQA